MSAWILRSMAPGAKMSGIARKWSVHERYRLGAAVDSQLAQDAVHMILHSRQLDSERPRDHLVGHSLLQQAQNLGFPRRQCVRGGTAAARQGRDASKQGAGDLGRA